MKSLLTLIAAVVCAAAVVPAAPAGFDFPGCRKPDCCSTGCATGCCAPACLMVCCPECKTVKEKDSCFDVECEYVCIPPVQLPGCGNGLASLCGLSGCGTRGHGHGSAAACGGCGLQGCADCGPGAINGCVSQDSPGFLGRLKDKLCGCRIRKVKRLTVVTSETEKQVVEWKIHTYAIPACKSCCGTAPVFGCGPCGE